MCLCMYAVELETEVHTKVRYHGEGPYKGLPLVESGRGLLRDYEWTLL